jgi:glycosyltransferase involved in cell wall biosynthesis
MGRLGHARVADRRGSHRPCQEHLVFFGLRPWRDLARLGFHRSSGATFGHLLRSGRFSPVTYVHFERRWGHHLAIEEISRDACAVGLPGGLPVGRLAAVRRVNRRLQAARLARHLLSTATAPRLFWLSDWWQVEVGERLGPGRFVLECFDDYSQVFASNRSRLAEFPAHQRRAADRADLVVAVDRRLLAGLDDGSPKFVVSPNAVSAEFLASAQREHREPAALAGRSRPRLVVVAGEWSFSTRVDHELLLAALDKLGGWTLVLAGVPARPRGGLAALLRHPGVVALPTLPQLDLVPLLRACDVGAVPYRAAGARDVLKTYEYLGCGLPVVLTADEPPRQLARWTTKAPDLDGFVAACRRMASEGLDDQARVRSILSETTWERRTEDLLRRLDAIRPCRNG